MLKISRDTFYKYLKRWPDVKEHYEMTNEIVLDEAEACLVKMWKGEEPGFEDEPQARLSALKFYAQTKGKKRGFIIGRDMHVTGDMGPVEIKVEAVPPPEYPDDED